MKSNFCLIQNNFFHSLRLNANEIEYHDFDLTKDILIFGNFLSDLEIQQCRKLLSRGAKFIFNNLWEVYGDQRSFSLFHEFQQNGISFHGYKCKQPEKHLKSYFVPSFFWYTEALNSLQYPKVDRTNYKKKFLLLMNKKKNFRDKIFTSLEKEFDNAIYSYRGDGKFLSNDKIPFDDRFINLEWYENTIFSLVVETYQEVNDFIFLTEKTFKPISIGHPFLLFGNKDSLKLLKENGFKTFSMFDEYYDDIDSTTDRMQFIIDEIRNFNLEKAFMDEDVIEHNYNLFYQKDLIMSRIHEEIVVPLKEFLNE